MNKAKQAPPSESRIVHRYKLSRKMAYPLGFELLERAFADLPQWSRFEFWFKDRPTYLASDFARTLAASQPYPIVCVRHRISPPGFCIYVYPVARALKSIAQESFLTSGIKTFREFIKAEPAAPNPRDLRAAFFDPLTHTCMVRTSTECTGNP
jgi:hypothetical protein